MMKFIWSLILMVIGNWGFSQKAIYEGNARWMVDSLGVEKYEYNVGDSLLIPDGIYDLKLKRDLANGGIHELLHFESKYSKGVLDGPVKIHMYKISFNILDFDNAGVVSETKGQKMRIEGMYSAGNPVGEWKFVHKNMDMPGDSSILNYNLDSRLLKYNSGRISGGGKIDENQLFDGKWIWQESDVEKIYTYDNGILTGVSKTNASLDTLLRIEKTFAETSDSIVMAEDFRKWVYFPGAEDNLERLQSLVDRNMKRGWKAHDFADRQMSHLPNFSLPEIKGTARIYHRISPTNRSELKNQLQNIRFLDSLLMKEIELPVFQLRREKHSEVDSLLRVGEDFMLRNAEVTGIIHDFLKDSSRLISPYLLQIDDRTKWNSHDAAAQYLIGKVAGQKDLFDVIMRSFEEEQEVLRVRGTVEELEEEWFYMNRAVETKYQPDSLSFLASDIYNRFLINDFEDRKSEYSAISSLKDRREFLKNSVSYSRFFYEFFKDSAYWVIEKIDTKLSQEYTQYLYNPYTGDYNVEVVVKRRFLEKILETYWPHRLGALRNVDSGTTFIEKYNETVQIIEMLLKFAHVKDAEAKRLERRVRRAKGAENIDEFLTEFLKNNPPQVNENKK